MTTSHCVIAVIAMALGFFLAVMGRRASLYHRRAYQHYVLAGKPLRWETAELRLSRIEMYHIKMMQKWMEARWHPWDSVDPDPPPPEPEP
jgi:hypothetical protein